MAASKDQLIKDNAVLAEQVEALTTQVKIARRGLVAVSNVEPVAYTQEGGKNLSFVRAFSVQKEKAEKALLAMSDVGLEDDE